ncbi:MAG: hypothetical protein IOD12_09320, partial [Silvanigrellales bacterium]|nr:hypothetical protein [Silvanigrellales bacterium]
MSVPFESLQLSFPSLFLFFGVIRRTAVTSLAFRSALLASLFVFCLGSLFEPLCPGCPANEAPFFSEVSMLPLPRPKLLPVVTLFASLSVVGCGADSASDLVTQSPGDAPTQDAPKVAATKKKLGASLKALAAKAKDPKLKKALDEAQVVLAKVPTAPAAEAFYAIYTAPDSTVAVVERLNRVAAILDMKTDPSAPRINIDLKAFTPKVDTLTGEVASLPGFALAGEAVLAAADTGVHPIDHKAIATDIMDAITFHGNFNMGRGTKAGFTDIFLQALEEITCMTGSQRIKCQQAEVDVTFARGLAHSFKYILVSLSKEHVLSPDGLMKAIADVLATFENFSAAQPAERKAEINKELVALFGRRFASSPVKGTLTLPSGQVTLQLNGGNDLTLVKAGAFEFARKIVNSGRFKVTVKTPPGEATCTVSKGEGYLGEVEGPLTVTCAFPQRTVGGSVSGLPEGKSVVLALGTGNEVTAANGTFAFPTSVAAGSSYAVTVKTNPTGYVCQVTGGATGTATSNVTNVAVRCAALVSVGGNVTGLPGGKSVVLTLNGEGDLTAGAGAFTFPTAVATGSAYTVAVKTNPTGYACAVTGGTGTASGNITNVSVACNAQSYTVGGALTGLAGTGETMELRLTTTNPSATYDLTVDNTDGPFAFPQAIASGAGYTVSVLTQPFSKVCSVASGATGTVVGAAISNVTVTCADPQEYTIGGTVTGLTSGTLVLRLNGGNDKSIAASGAYTFAGGIEPGGSYSVTVATQPAGLTCTVANGSGTANADVTNANVTCAASATEKFIGVSTQAWTPNGLADADTHCNTHAPVSGLTWKALLVDGAARRACSGIDCSGSATGRADWPLLASTVYRQAEGSQALIGTTSANAVFT